MHWRRWVSLLACVGVLLHAAAGVRHHAFMVTAELAASSSASQVAAQLASDLTFICHAPLPGEAPAALPGDGEAPKRQQLSCPICSGLVSAVALAAPEVPPLLLPEAPRFIAALPEDERRTVQRQIRPPSRGPPLFPA